MVRLIIFMFCTFISFSVGAISEEELRKLIGIKEQKDKLASERFQSSVKHEMSPNRDTRLRESRTSKTLPAVVEEQSPTRSTMPTRLRSSTPLSSGASSTTVHQSDATYIPPPRGSASNGNFEGYVQKKNGKVRFGIPLGAEIEGELVRNINNVEPGFIKIRVTRDVIGKHLTLPAGSELFASKSYNGSSRRLELFVTHGITVDDKEFKLQGVIRDRQNISGLAGVVTENRAVVAKGAKRGAVEASRAALASLLGSGETVAKTAAAAAGGSIISDVNNDIEINNRQQQYVINVRAQSLVVRVEKSF